jgi:hypothetical protein
VSNARAGSRWAATCVDVLAFGFTGIRHPNFGGSRAHSSPPVVDPEGGEPLLYAYLHDPSGAGPRLSILQVPEPKTAKNRLHLEARVSGEGAEAERRARTSRRSTS